MKKANLSDGEKHALFLMSLANPDLYPDQTKIIPIELEDRNGKSAHVFTLVGIIGLKHVAERLGNTAKQSMMVYILKHVDALCNDAKTGKTYSDETTYQRCLDVVNYMVLYAALDHEEQPHANNTEQPRSTDSGADRNCENAPEPDQWSDLTRTTKT